ncbi:PAS domain-containing sensor histidine kinase [Terrisporobacter sp.]|uniref:PAS domain-containing sensor histidine kinase n=1 Tax=Terrisporobacter sp. TaxID=1965305 RepID=UPI00263913EE|nr:PAS domain-containing sensor histidine kinase [Terrisporobacter sp.]
MDEISIYKKMSNLKDLKNYESVKSILNDICKDIMDYTKSNYVSIFLYNKVSQLLDPFIYIEKGGYFEINEMKNYIDKSTLEEIMYGDLIFDKCEKREKINKPQIRTIYDFLDEHNIQHLECYKIAMDDEFIGCLNIAYKFKCDNNNISNDFITYIRNMIGIIIRNYKLNQDMRIEIEKRIKVENELEDYLESSADMFTVFDLNGDLIKINSNWKEILGWELKQLINNNFMECIYPEDVNKINQLILSLPNNNDIIKNKKYSITIRHLCKDGDLKWIDWSIRYSEKSNVFIASGKDITKRIADEERKKNLEEKVKLESVKNEFFANISHEFKTPLNIILGTMQIMQKNIDNGNISIEILQRHIKGIRQNSYRLLRLVNNVIDISKMDIGYYNISLSNNNIVNIIEEITISVVQYVESKDINLIFDTEEEVIITACDPDAIERVILNLLSNEIKYTSPISGEIIVKVSRDVNNVFISVKDNGIGIPKDKLDIIFDRFGQVNSDLTKKNEGSGIGLSLVQYLVELHNGHITVESKLGEGAEFIVTLPIRTMEFNYNDNCNLGNRDCNIEKCKIEFSDIYD